MKPLYELAAQYQELQTITDMDPDTRADTLEGLTGDIEAKAEAITVVRANMDANVVAIDAEIKRLKARKKTIQNSEIYLREYLRFNMIATKIKNITCKFFTITLAKGIPIAIIDDVNELPDDLVTVELVTKPDMRRILARMKTGEVVPGAHLATSEPSIRIK